MRSLIFQNHDLYQIHFTSCSCDVLIYSSYIHLSYFINVNTIEALSSGDLWRVQYLSPNEGFLLLLPLLSGGYPFPREWPFIRSRTVLYIVLAELCLLG